MSDEQERGMKGGEVERTQMRAEGAQEESAPKGPGRARDVASFMIENFEALSELVDWWKERQKRIAPVRRMEKRDRPSRGYRIEMDLVERVRELSRDEGTTFEDALNLVIDAGLRQVKG